MIHFSKHRDIYQYNFIDIRRKTSSRITRWLVFQKWNECLRPFKKQRIVFWMDLGGMCILDVKNQKCLLRHGNTTHLVL
jgi:hypothetical protein